MEAAEIVAGAGLTAASLFEICLFVGGVALTCYAAGEVIENRDEIAEFGKNVIDSISLDDVPDGWLFEFVDNATGQVYLIGSEVVEYVQSCTWRVISSGGSPDPDKKPGVDKDNIIHFPGIDQTTGKIYSEAVATFFVGTLSKLYQKWVNGEELTESEQAALKPLMEAGVDQDDIAKQWSGEMFDYFASFTESYNVRNPASSRIDTYNYKADFNFPVCGFYSSGSRHTFSFLYLFNGNASGLNEFSLAVSSYVDGVYRGITNYAGRGSWSSQYISVVDNFTFTYSANFPIFSSKIEAEAYLYVIFGG